MYVNVVNSDIQCEHQIAGPDCVSLGLMTSTSLIFKGWNMTNQLELEFIYVPFYSGVIQHTTPVLQQYQLAYILFCSLSHQFQCSRPTGADWPFTVFCHVALRHIIRVEDHKA